MKTKRIKAVLVGTHHEYWHASNQGVCLVLPADAESYAKLVQQVDEAIERGINRWLAGIAGPDGCKRLPHEVLKSIGITPPRTGKGRK